MNQSRRGIKLSPMQIKRLLIILALVAVVLTALVLMLRNRVKQQFGREEQQVLSASVTTGSISSSVYGSGLLADEDVEQLEIPNGVDVETLYVSRGEKVEEGQLLASAEQNSVVTAMAAVMEEIDALDEGIASAMEQGALMLLSLDGTMAVDVETDRLSPGDSLTITDSSGRSYTGTVDTVLDTTATVLITDKDSLYGDTVQRHPAECPGRKCFRPGIPVSALTVSDIPRSAGLFPAGLLPEFTHRLGSGGVKGVY